MTKPSYQWRITSAAGANLPHCPRPRRPPLPPPRLFPSLAPPARATPTQLHRSSLRHPPTFPLPSPVPSTLLHQRLRPPRPTCIASTTWSTTSSATTPRSASRWRGSGSRAATPSWCTGRSPGFIRRPHTCSQGCISRWLGCLGRSAAGRLRRGRSIASWEVRSRWGTGAGMMGARRKAART